MGKHNPKGRFDSAEADYIKASAAGRFDDSASAFFARELSYVRSRVLEVQKAPLNAFSVFPVQTDVPAGAATAEQKVYDAIGVAKIISNYADDLPRADVLGQTQSVKVYTVGNSYGYNVVEVENAQFAGVNLDVYRARAARRAIDQRINTLAWKGDAAHGIIGFLYNPNMTAVTLPGDGTSSSTKLKDKTPAQIIRDVNAVINAVETATAGGEVADTVLLSTAAYDHIAGTPRSDYSDLTILGFLKESHPGVRFMKVSELNGAGASNADLLIAGRFDPDMVRLEIPERFRQLPVEKRNLEYVVDCISRVIGVTVTVPVAFAKAVGA